MISGASERILVFAPTGADSRNACALLRGAGFDACECKSLEAVTDEAAKDAGALLIAEEGLVSPRVNTLSRFLEEQPSWSDIPLIVITSGGDTTQASMRAYNAAGSRANITLIERPFRTITLLSTIHSALRSRRRQYEVRDLLERLEDKVAERTLRLEQTIAELEAFSYSVSHDLRAPLRAMQGYSHILMEDHGAQLPDEGKEYVSRIIAVSNRLDRLVQDILTYSKCSREDLEFEPVDLHRLVAEILQEYPDLRENNAQVKVKAPLLPVRGHEALLSQCISNLIGNGVKFVPPGRVPVVEIWTEQMLAQVRIYFKDNGIGIEKAHHHKIFGMFERLVHDRDYEGTGIGLAIVAKAVERMGGKVGLDSVVGVGSTFWIQLPGAQI